MRRRNVTLVLMGLVSLAAYILACRPAFSPDGSKILFPYSSPKGEDTGIALFDRRTGESRPIFTVAWPRGTRSDKLPIAAQWTSDGENVLVAWSETKGPDHLRIVLLPLEGERAARYFAFPDREDLIFQLVNPLPVVGDRVFVGGKFITRLDLQTGEIAAAEVGEDTVLVGQGDRVYYATERGEIGRIDTDSLARSPLIPKIEVEADPPFVAVSRDGSRLAVSGKVGPEYKTHVYRGDELEKTISLGSGELAIGNSEWSPDGETVYTAFGRKSEAEGAVEFGFLETPLGGDGIREVLVFRVSTDERSDRAIGGFQIALSPDGETITATSTYLDVAEGDRALYLVGLSGSERKVTKIPVPVPKTGEKK